MNELLTLRDVAERFQVSEWTIYRIKNEIGFVKVGRALRFRPEDVDQYVRRNRSANPGEPITTIDRGKNLKHLKI